MGKFENIGALVLLALAVCGYALAYPDDVPKNPVKYRRYLRRRPVPNHPELEIYEVREVYYVRRPTPPPKNIHKLTDLDMELRIRCDFEPTLPLCRELNVQRGSDWTGNTLIRTTAQRIPAWGTSTSTSTSTSTTTELPTLPLLPDLEEVTQRSPTEEQGLEPDDAYNDEFDDEQDEEDVATDYTVTDTEPELYLNPSGSIGGIDTS